MAEDDDLAVRVRELVSGDEGWTEKRMFGGIAFLIDGNMAVATDGRGLIVRVAPDESDALIARTCARRAEMGGRPMRGWLRVDAAQLRDRRELTRWVERGANRARSLPAKPASSG